MERGGASVTSCINTDDLLDEVRATLCSRTKSKAEAENRFSLVTAELERGIYARGETLNTCAECISDAATHMRKEKPRRSSRQSKAVS